MKALGTYNFAGDIGKMTLPAAASLLLVVMPWRRRSPFSARWTCGGGRDLRADAAPSRGAGGGGG